MAVNERARLQRFGQLELEIITQLSKRVRNKIQLTLPQILEEPLDHITAVQLTRNAFGVSLDVPIPHLVRSVEEIGVTVLILPIRFKGGDSFSTWYTVSTPQSTFFTRKPLVVLASDTPGDRLRFSLAHEIGHLVLHAAVRGPAPELEEEANNFASELLLPESILREQLTDPVTLTSVARLKPVWGVSLQALIRRAYDLELITKRQYHYWMKQVTTQGWRYDEPITIPAEKPRALRKIAELLYGNPINYQKLAREFDIQPHFAKQLIEAYGTVEEYGIPSIRKPEEVNQLVPQGIGSSGSKEEVANKRKTK